jgi:hypothetical protein
LQDVHVIIVPWQVKQEEAQKSQLLVSELAIARPVGQAVKHWFW